MVDKGSTMVDKKLIEKPINIMPDEIINLMKGLGKRSVSPALMRKTILSLCAWREFSIAELAHILNRNEKYIKTNYIQPLINENKIAYTIPAMKTHPHQKYRTIGDSESGR